MYISFQANSQQHDMQSEQLVSHVIRFFFLLLPGDDGVHIRSSRTGNMSTGSERGDMTFWDI